jgi:putative ABC transport system permease protein
VVALGLGTLVVASMWLVETRVRAAILAQIPADAPSVFLVDIRPSQWDQVQELLMAAGATTTDQVPVVMARIASIDGVSVDDLARDASDDDTLSRRVLTREQRLTWRATLTSDNRIVEGALWSDPARPEVSVERRFAERLGVHVGSRITFDLQGVPLDVDVTSLRSVEWQSFSINFFLVLEPGALEGAPALYLSNARVPEENEQSLQDALAARFPNVTMIRVRPILERVTELIERLVAGLRVLGWFTVVAGVTILAGAVSSTSLQRAAEVALLKTLGVTRGGVVLLLAIEHALCGALAGTVGAGGALLLAWGYLHKVAEIDVPLPLVIVPLAALGCAILTSVSGIAAGARALTVRPVEALRG